MKGRIAAAIICTFVIVVAALAQSNPGLRTGQVPTAAQWNSYFAAKQDVLGFTPVNKAGDTMLGRLVTAPTGTSAAGFSLPAGTAPSSPVDGDVWTTVGGMFVRINGTTVGPLSGPSAGSFAADAPLQVTFPAGVVTYSVVPGTSGTIPRSNGTTWVNTTATYPNTATGTGTVMRADGTNWTASTAAYPNTTAAGTMLSSASANTIGATMTPVLGAAGAGTGSLGISGTTSGTVTLSVASAAGTHTIALPTADGNNGEVLTTNGSGQWGWTAAGGTGTVTSITISAGGGIAVSGTCTVTTTGTCTIAASRAAELFWYAGSTCPATYSLLADGSAVSRATYATLFGIVGTTYGSGDGSTTFNVPNLQTARRFVRARGGSAVGTNEADATDVNGLSATTTATINAQTLQPNTGGAFDMSRGPSGAIVSLSSTDSETRPINISMTPCIHF